MKMKLVQLIMPLLVSAILVVVVSCKIDVPENLDNKNQQLIVASSGHSYLSSVKVAIFADHSISIAGAGIPKLQQSDITPLIQLISAAGGELVVGKIGVLSKENLARYRPNSSLQSPLQKGDESASAYMKRLQQFKAKRALHAANDEGDEKRLEHFNVKLSPILDYRSLERATDLSGAMESAISIMSEQDNLIDPQKYIVFVTDGLNTGYRLFPEKVPSDVTFIIVNTILDAADLSIYKHVKTTTIDGAIRIITQS